MQKEIFKQNWRTRKTLLQAVTMLNLLVLNMCRFILLCYVNLALDIILRHFYTAHNFNIFKEILSSYLSFPLGFPS